MTARKQLDLDRELVESIDVEHGLSEWEAEFVDSVLRQVRSEARELTIKQRAAAERIQRKLDERTSR